LRKIRLSDAIHALIVFLVIFFGSGCDLVRSFSGGENTPQLATPTVPQATTIPVTPTTVTQATVTTATALPITINRPANWVAAESAGRLVISANANMLAGGELEGPAVLIRQVEGATTAEAVLGQATLAGAETVRKENVNLGGKAGQLVEAKVVAPISGRGYRMVLVATVYDGKGYLVIASAPLEQWDKAWPELQGIINSVAFK
jgi:hypothetical protein